MLQLQSAIAGSTVAAVTLADGLWSFGVLLETAVGFFCERDAAHWTCNVVLTTGSPQRRKLHVCLIPISRNDHAYFFQLLCAAGRMGQPHRLGGSAASTRAIRCSMTPFNSGWAPLLESTPPFAPLKTVDPLPHLGTSWRGYAGVRHLLDTVV